MGWMVLKGELLFWGIAFSLVKHSASQRATLFLKHVWNFQQIDKTWALMPLNSYGNTSNDIRKYGHVFEPISFADMGIVRKNDTLRTVF